ncbi:MAG: hypothetical protein AABY22_33470 [Nanoarchaeota archaeon]
MVNKYRKSKKSWQTCYKCKKMTRSLRRDKEGGNVCSNCSKKEYHIISAPPFKPRLSLEEALNKIYEVRTQKIIYKSGKHNGKVALTSQIHVPQALIGHKVRLTLADK